MKRTFSILIVIVSAFLLASCARSLPQRITRLADKVEAKGADYSLEDWQKVAEKFEGMVMEFVDNYDKYKPSEKADVIKATAKFTAAAVKSGAGSVVSGLDGAVKKLGGGINDLIEGAKGFLDGLGL